MATFTHLGDEDAARISAAHGLGGCRRVVPVEAGTVNSNYLLETDSGCVFLRIYEQQKQDGVAYEWQLLDHLARHGVPVPRRIGGTAPGEVRVNDRPVALFEQVVGQDLCQALVSQQYAEAVGEALGRAHRAGESFAVRREGRFTVSQLEPLLARARSAARPELMETLNRLSELAQELTSANNGPLAGLPVGVIHGDLFRDNVLWRDGQLLVLLDWESASHGTLVYDVAVTFLAWCCGDALDFELGAALLRGYQRQRPLSSDERTGLWWAARLACLRFATTRITDVYLRGGYPPSYKPYQRFLLRLDTVEQMSPARLAELLS